MVFSCKPVKHLDTCVHHLMDVFCSCVCLGVFQCSFGVLHEAERLRMDCPSCKKSTCSQCRSPVRPTQT